MTVTADVPELASIVAGSPRHGADTATHRNPAHPAEISATVALADARTAEAAIEAAARAEPEWRTATAPARGDLLRRAATLIDERVESIAHDLTREQGKTLAESRREVQLAATIFRYYAARALDSDGDTYPSHDAGVLLFTRREPLGVVTAITPWNFPASLPAWKLASALAYGNSVVWKPAEIVPCTALHLYNAVVQAGVPEGVLNVVLGKGSEVGDVLVTHPAVAAVTFTGSTPVGRAIQRRAAASGKKIQLELGGKNPAIVMADADLDVVSQHISVGAFGAAGQKCTATSRVFAHRSVLAELLERLRDQADRWVLGDPLDPHTTLGPVASADQLATVLGYVERARRDGARIVSGGGQPSGPLSAAYFVQPTILTDLAPTHAAVREEIFGPVAAVLAFDAYDDAVAQANDTPFGLAASIFTHDLDVAMRLTRDIRAGVVRVNRATSGMEFHVPFGGMKESGYGQRELGTAAREFFTEMKTIYLGSP